MAQGLTLWAMLLSLVWSRLALADAEIPTLYGHVMDTAHVLSDADIRSVDRRLDNFRQQTGYAIVVFVIGSLDGESVDDVAYKAFNKWRVGEKGKDNGVLLVIAPAERKIRIETGKGVGGALTDLQSNDIIRQVIAPPLRQNRFREAIEKGCDAIAQVLVEDLGDAGPGRRRARETSEPMPVAQVLFFLFLMIFPIVMRVRSRFRGGGVWFIGGGGGSWGGGDGGGGDSGGSGYSGDGGSSGGGGSSDSY
jgi:uncharacterized protein